MKIVRKQYMIFILIFLLLIPFKLNAELAGTFMEYEGSITTDEERNKFRLPYYVFSEPIMNEFYVIDARSMIMVYTADFFPLYTLGKWDGIESPVSLTVDLNGNLYVGQSSSAGNNPRHRISVFNACFKWERDIYLEGFEKAESFFPNRLAIDKKGNLYVASLYYPGVVVLDKNGIFLEIISPYDEGKKANVSSVTIDSTGKIYLVSSEMGHIYVYDENRQFLFKFGEKGGSTGKLSQPKAIGVDSMKGKLYVVDYMRHAVNVYDKDGNYLFEFGGQGWSPGWFQHPIDITVDNNGRIWVADFFNERIQVFKPRLISKKSMGIDVVDVRNLTFASENFSYDNLLGYSLQNRLKIEQRNQKTPLPFP